MWIPLLSSIPAELEADVNCKSATNYKTEGITLSRALSYSIDLQLSIREYFRFRVCPCVLLIGAFGILDLYFSWYGIRCSSWMIEIGSTIVRVTLFKLFVIRVSNMSSQTAICDSVTLITCLVIFRLNVWWRLVTQKAKKDYLETKEGWKYSLRKW